MGVAQGSLHFKVIVDHAERDRVTAFAGLPLVIETLRAAVRRSDYQTLARALGYGRWKVVRRHVESVLLLAVAGGECVDDLRMLRADAGLCALLGYRPSSPTQAKEFLYRFHQDADGATLGAQDDARLSVAGKAQIRPEGPGLRALDALRASVVDAVQGHDPKGTATLDVDATIIEASKKSALKAYEGTVGYQPQMAWWAEQGVWVADQFRDGNVNAEFEAREFLELAFARVPAEVMQRRMRADSALYNERALTWADEQDIEFAVSADMSQDLQRAARDVSEARWKPYRTLKRDEADDPSEERQWAEVEFLPNWGRNYKKGCNPFRYIAIRVRSRQRDLFVDEHAEWRHFAVVTNMAWEGERLLRWHRDKQGTVEHGHGVLKGDLAGGTLPCGRFGANAAWWRLNVLAHNVLALLKVVALPSQMSAARPKALRFSVFNVAGRLLRRGRQLMLRLSPKLQLAGWYDKARRALLALTGPPPVVAG